MSITVRFCFITLKSEEALHYTLAILSCYVHQQVASCQLCLKRQVTNQNNGLKEAKYVFIAVAILCGLILFFSSFNPSCIRRPALPPWAWPFQQQPPLLPVQCTRGPVLLAETLTWQQPLDVWLQHPLPYLLAQAPPWGLLHWSDLLWATGIQGLAGWGLCQDL